MSFLETAQRADSRWRGFLETRELNSSLIELGGFLETSDGEIIISELAD